MNNTATIMRSTMAALLVGALTMPGLAAARGHDGHDGYNGGGHRSGHHERHHKGHRGHWRRHGRHHRGHSDRVVVVREPVYVQSRPAVVSVPLWAPPTNGISVFLGTRW